MRRLLKIAAITILVILAACAVFVGYAYYQARNITDTKNLQDIVDKLCTKYISEGKATGLFIGIIQGDRTYVKGYGLIDKEHKTVPDSNTLFEMGSVSKIFTSEIVQLLVEKRQLNWDDDIVEHLPHGVALPLKDGTKLLHLASHTSGFPRLPEAWFPKLESDQCDPYSSLSMQDLYSYLNNCTNKKRPAMGNYNYSNFGAGLLGHIAEWKTGKDYETLLQENICRPLGMPNTSCKVTVNTRFATGYDEQGKKTCHWSFPIIHGAGAVKSDGADMLRFLKANMDNNTTISASLMKTQYEVAKIPGGAVGYGWHIDKMNGAFCGVHEILWHNGGTGGFRTYIGFVRGTNRGIVVLSNGVNSGFDKLAVHLILKTALISLR